MDKLKVYKSKRNFKVTGEPNGDAAVEKSAKEKKFAVQLHAATRLHYDLRLEHNGVLLSWAVPKGPSFDPSDKRLAVMVEDHPLDYAGFEGTIPKGEYGGGTVMLYDEGTYIAKCDFEEGKKNGSLKFTLYGQRLKGDWALVRLKDGKENEWLLIKERDGFALSSQGEKYGTSVKSGRTMEQIARGEAEQITKNPPVSVKVELCKQVDKLPDNNDWLFEVKYDGYRILSFCENGGVTLQTRNGKDYTDKFKGVANALTKLVGRRAVILDGEIVCVTSEGKTDFGTLQECVKTGKGTPVYVIFDILALDGEDLRKLPLSERKSRLSGLLKGENGILRESGFVIGRGSESAAAARKLGLEGIVGKRVNSPYAGNRGGDWIKYKCRLRQEFVIGGYAERGGGISSLLLGVYEQKPQKQKKLTYVGRVGTGITHGAGSALINELNECAVEISPFSTSVKPTASEHIVWLDPVFVGEVEFAEWTKQNKLRQASFIGLRNDKDPLSVVAEHPSDSETAPTPNKHESKIEFTDKKIEVMGVNKSDVVRYYEAAAEKLLGYIGNRLLSIVRCHGGGKCFFNKHPGAGSTANVMQVDGSEKPYFYVTDTSQLLNEVRLGAVEFHIWGSKVQNIDSPDMLVFDLDPDEGLPLGTLREGVLLLKDALIELGLNPFLKTSGGKGYHIVADFPCAEWSKFREFAKQTAEYMQAKHPDLFTANVRKTNRKNKIYIDWARNVKGATAVAPYSLRARPNAPVSMPIKWEDLFDIAPQDINVRNYLNFL